MTESHAPDSCSPAHSTVEDGNTTINRQSSSGNMLSTIDWSYRAMSSSPVQHIKSETNVTLPQSPLLVVTTDQLDFSTNEPRPAAVVAAAAVLATGTDCVDSDAHPAVANDNSGASLTVARDKLVALPTVAMTPSLPTVVSVPPLTVGSRRIVIKSLTGEQFAIELPLATDMAVSSFLLTAASQSAALSTAVGGASYANVGQSDDADSCDYRGVEQHSLTDANVVEAGEGAVSDGCAPCLVCGDRGSGFHYSVYSCEGCKGFFKRTVQRNMSYVCKESGVCQINKITRNSCQHCRFRRCLDVGMKKEAVREDRTPGGKHRPKRFRLDDGECSGGGELGDWNSSEEDELLISQLVESRPDIVPELEDVSRVLSGCDEVDANEFIQLSYSELKCIIQWAKRVPGFNGLVLEDQMSLLKSSFMELTILRLAYRSIDCSGAVRFSDTLLLSPAQCSQLAWCEDVVNCTLDFLSKLRAVQFDHTEFCVLSAILLTYPDAGDLLDRPSVCTLHNSLLDLLSKYSTSRYADAPRRCQRLLLRLPALRSISHKAAENFLSCSLETDVKMDRLVQLMIQ